MDLTQEGKGGIMLAFVFFFGVSCAGVAGLVLRDIDYLTIATVGFGAVLGVAYDTLSLGEKLAMGALAVLTLGDGVMEQSAGILGFFDWLGLISLGLAVSLAVYSGWIYTRRVCGYWISALKNHLQEASDGQSAN